MSVILAVETATSCCSVALRIDGDIVQRSEVGNNIHSKVLLGMVESLLLEASITAQNIEAVAVGQGPGSFTGLRIGVGVGQGLAFGANCPMIGVSSLDALALQVQRSGPVISAIDARMGEVYWAEYHKNESNISRIGELRVTPPADVSISVKNELDANVSLVGNAWAVYEREFGSLVNVSTTLEEAAVFPDASALLILAERRFAAREWVSAIDFAPIYVRDNVAKKSTKKLPGRRL